MLLLLPVPALHAPRTLEEVEALGRTLAYPVVVKPARAGCWHRPGIDPALSRCRAVQVEDAQALMRLCCQLAPHGLELVIQDRVPGDVDQQWTVHACIARGGTPNLAITPASSPSYIIRTVATLRLSRSSIGTAASFPISGPGGTAIPAAGGFRIRRDALQRRTDRT